MNVVDSSAWFEYFGDGPNAAVFAEAIESPDELVVPTLTLFEVFEHRSVFQEDDSLLSTFKISPHYLGIRGIDPLDDTGCKTLFASIDYP